MSNRTEVNDDKMIKVKVTITEVIQKKQITLYVKKMLVNSRP